MMARCSVTQVWRGDRQQCIREMGHDERCAFGAVELRVVACDSCGEPVFEVNRFRHRGCPTPDRIPAATRDAIDRLREKVGVR